MKKRTLITFSLLLSFLFSLPSAQLWAAEETRGLIAKKTATYDYQTQKGTITLENYVEGTVKKTRSTTPADVIFMLDVSNSMGDKTVYTTGPLATMISCVNSCLGELATDATTRGIDHRAAVISFAATATLVSDFTSVNTTANLNEIRNRVSALNNHGWTNTNFALDMAYNIMTAGNGSTTYTLGKNFSWPVSTSYFTDGGGTSYYHYAYMQKVTGGYNYSADKASSASTNNLYFWNNTTNTTNNSNTIYYGARTTSNKYVILLTDGSVTADNITYDGTDMKYENAAIQSARKLKDAGATVYCISFMGRDYNTGATYQDPSTLAALTETQRNNVCQFLNTVSSNYPYATSLVSDIVSHGYVTEISNDNYGSDAGKAEAALKDVFEGIIGEIEVGCAAIELEDVELLDVMDDTHFTLPDGADASSIKVYTKAFTAYNGSTGVETYGPENVLAAGTDYQISIVDNSVKISDISSTYDLSTNWWGKSYNAYTDSYTTHGSKLFVEIPFVVKDGNTATGTFDTNTGDSGVTAENDIDVRYNKPTLPIYKMTITNEGLKAGESAVYYIYDYDNPSVVFCRVVLTGDGSSSVSKDILYVDGGQYTVEETGWGWTYVKNTSITQATNSTTGTEFKFVSTGKTGTLLDHDEDVKLNKFKK